MNFKTVRFEKRGEEKSSYLWHMCHIDSRDLFIVIKDVYHRIIAEVVMFHIFS